MDVEFEWSLDARVVVNMDHSEVGVKWHAESRGEESRAMLDLSVGGLDAVFQYTVHPCSSVPSESTQWRFPRFAP